MKTKNQEGWYFLILKKLREYATQFYIFPQCGKKQMI